VSKPVGLVGGTQRLSPRDWSLRVRLAVVLLVPGLVALVLGGLRIADQAGEAGELNRVERYATVQGGVATLVERLQQERYQAAVFVAQDRSADLEALESAIVEVDATAAETRPTVTALYDGDVDLVRSHRQALQGLARLPQLRNLVKTSNAPASAVISRYSELVDQIVGLDDTLLLGINANEVDGLAGGLGGLATARNEAMLQLALITAAAGTAEPPATALAGLSGSAARLTAGLTDFRAGLDAGQRVRFGGLIAGASNTGRDRLVQSLSLRTEDGALPAETVNDAVAVLEPLVAEIDAAEDSVRAELMTTSTERREAAANLAGVNAVALLLSLLLGVAIVVLISRAMINSLRTLRRSALDIAEKRLPEAVLRMREGAVPDVDVEPVPVTTREEIGQVARAFDAVHAQALRLAAEQATLQISVNSMFVNLARRSQSLVDRQLQLIEDLESNEQDPDQLSNLFRLDHLATRMRRNSDNLLVLSGTDLAKRNSPAVPVVDVLQAALSEVEQYERIEVDQPPSVVVVGRAASDVQHLLAELLDNATSFSPPDTTVTMTTTRTGEGAVVVEIADAGVGMARADVAETNVKLGRSSEVTVTASRRMGLFVVGRLAARHGIEVRLIAAETDTGLTARVILPPRLVEVNARTGRWDSSETAAPTRSGAGGIPQPRSDGDARPRIAPPTGRTVPTEAWAPPLTQAPPPSVGAPRPATERPPVDPPQRRPAAPPPRRGDPTPELPSPRTAPDTGLPRRSDRSPAVPPVTHPPAVRPTVDQPVARDTADFFVPTESPAPAAPEPIRAPAPPRAEPSATPAPAGRTPIFEEVASGWFRSYRQVPINWQASPSDEAARSATPTPPSWNPPSLTPSPSALPLPVSPAVPAPRPPGPGGTPSTDRRDSAFVDSAFVDSAFVDSAAFATSADEGWRAATEVVGRRDEADTGTGLPKRTPGARLLPGSVGSGAGPTSTGPGGPTPQPAAPRDADAVRGRLGDYQRGVRRGRGRLEHPDPLDGT